MTEIRDESRHMLRAIRLAERGRGLTAPNPVVGAVVVRGGRVVGEGWHPRLGGPHAEAMALERAGRLARGATLYCTLEPCAHHGRTPPCTDAILAAGVRRCVIGVRDPHRIVDGRGLQQLRAAGVRVEVGLLADQVQELMGGYLRAHRERRPRVVWKVAMTLDGRIADRTGRSKWITSTESRSAGHALRARHDAILVGARTARLDDPRLTVRGSRRGRDPLRVVCDTGLRSPLDLKLFSRGLASGTVVACGRGAPVARERALLARGVRVWRLPGAAAGVSPRALARRLAIEGHHEVLIEGGAHLGAAWWRAGLVDEVAAFVAPRVLGDGLSWCAPMGRTLATAIAGTFLSSRRSGTDLFIRMRVGRS